MVMSKKERKEKQKIWSKTYKKKYPERLRAANRKHYRKNKVNRLAVQEKLRKTPAHRMNLLYHAACRRARTKNLPIDIDKEYLLHLVELSNNCCQVTGIKFDYDRNPKYGKNPYAPSLDRIDSSKGYTKGNVQLVVFMYNTAKGDWEHEDVLKLAEALNGVATKK